MTSEEYYELILPYQDAMNLLLSRLDVLNHSIYQNAASKPVHTVYSRIKKHNSLDGKLARLNHDPTPANARGYLQDIAGVRVVCYFEQDAYQMIDALKRQNDLIVVNEKDYILHPKPNGYRSYHIILGIPVRYMDVTEYYPVEIQVRTLSMDFWASMEHRINYKQDRPDKKQVQTQLLKYADILKDMEQSFETYNENQNRPM
ncbi:MAG: (p)ppGpp synthetase [Lachnospiraceae bacterium]|nr:(p)ppGpp synthetase [Lachnospiraceae bacterium]